MGANDNSIVTVAVDGVELEGELIVPDGATGLVLFAHGSGTAGTVRGTTSSPITRASGSWPTCGERGFDPRVRFMAVGTVPRLGMTVDELGAYGIERMDDEDIERFLSIRNVGVLGLPAPGVPYLLPMSFGYDGGTSLYFSFLVDEDSRKADLADRADGCSFLVYNAETMFHWRSVLLTGTVRRLSEDERAALSASQTPAWRPELIQTASERIETEFYEFEVDEWTGLSHAVRPPAYDERSSRDATD